jgi:hypothetical protein
MIMTTEEHDLTVFDFTAMMTDHVGRFTVGFVGIGEDKAVSMGRERLRDTARWPASSPARMSLRR